MKPCADCHATGYHETYCKQDLEDIPTQKIRRDEILPPTEAFPPQEEQLIFELTTALKISRTELLGNALISYSQMVNGALLIMETPEAAPIVPMIVTLIIKRLEKVGRMH
jgi:hypothetical protein